MPPFRLSRDYHGLRVGRRGGLCGSELVGTFFLGIPKDDAESVQSFYVCHGPIVGRKGGPRGEELVRILVAANTCQYVQR